MKCQKKNTERFWGKRSCVCTIFQFDVWTNCDRILCMFDAGDVGLINMGMSDEDFTYMCTEVDFIVHAAAYVNLIYPYEVCLTPRKHFMA